MPANDQGQQVTWKITLQTETTLPSPAGPMTKGFNVYFTASNGLSGSVFLPEMQYSPQTVRDAIAQKIAVMSAVQDVTGTV